MSRRLKRVLCLFVIVSAGVISATPLDPQWMFTDVVEDQIYSSFQYCDTARNDNYHCMSTQYDDLVDTGSYNNTKYINFDYQFSSDSFYVVNRWDETDTMYRDYRPGYAGFKTAWDGGMVGFFLARYKFLILKHKGPNPNHKVTVAAWYNNGDCGAESFREELGSFSASAEWKDDTIVIPASFQNKIDSLRNGSLYFEFVFIINNIDPNDLTPGEPGNFKVDDIRLVGCNPIEKSPVSQTIIENQPCTLKVAASPAGNSGTDILTYQWMKDGAPIAGAVGAEYVIANTISGQAGTYTVAVTVPSTGLTFTSVPAVLTVTDDGCGCGAGTGLAFIPPIFIKVMSRRKRKQQK
ncbi:MAG: hypothetical protein JW863_14095 [Chitinispirillaceae bacterium]|nr:hypothetical protein [Chitinispirillaceae bacterium]